MMADETKLLPAATGKAYMIGISYPVTVIRGLTRRTATSGSYYS
jgi:hypothetical protein